jgi:oxygen-independent coproporphyrinogen-3 oxidase
MRTLQLGPGPDALADAITQGQRADYVYMYPPRQAFRSIDPASAGPLLERSLARPAPLNVYVHVPFCKQICAYCNLFAVAGGRGDDHDRYVDLIRAEIDHYAPQIRHRTVDTLYIGGGTPSLLRPELLARVTAHVSRTLNTPLDTIPEIALEVAPDTVTVDAVTGFREAGINRISLGVQTWDDGELNGIGRRHGTDMHEKALTIALNAGFDNVCVDLIYGLPGQTDATWADSLTKVIGFRPQTVCCYPLTFRPSTGYAAKGHTETGNQSQYHKYDEAHAALTDAGYIQETHVRWALPGEGGYRQKANHWAGQDILGVGAGARSYLHDVDLRNGYSVRHRRSALAGYQQRVTQGGAAWTDGIVMDDDERARKAVILGLGHLDRAAFRKRFSKDVSDLFAAQIDALTQADLVTIDANAISLTTAGQRHRDVVVQLFFSDRVRRLIAAHDYNE